MRTSEQIDEAADILERRGWAQGGPNGTALAWGDGGEGDVPLCIEGALIAATGEDRIEGFYSCPAHNAVAAYLDRRPFPALPVVDALWQWNDAPERTAADVIAALRACALIEAAREDQDAAWATYEQNVAVSA